MSCPPSRHPRHATRVLLALAAAVLLAAAAAPAGAAVPAWTTYHHDAQRSGVDPDGTSPLTPALAWQSPSLGAPIWNQPLILGSRVYVATVGDELYALEAATGQVVWRVSAGTPVPATALPCGDIEPTVGIVGTPVIDAAAGVIYAVADTWNGSQAQHLLEGFRLSDGARVLATPVDPPGAEPKAILQRTALNLDGGNVVFGFGGNSGDCSTYRGAVVSVPESGAAPSYWQVPIAAPSSGGGAVWAPAGPAVDAAGNVYASTGNPNPPNGQEATTFDYSDAVVSLSPSLGLSGFFEPPTWREDSNADRDLASGAPQLLPGGMLFQAGKNGTGYLIDEATMGAGAGAVFSAQVCGGAGSFGGDSYSGGVIYIPCTNGTQALSYDEAARSFAPLWKGPSDAFGPPIVSSGLVWSIATGGFGGGGTKLYGLEPATGKVRYTETLPSPVADHFGSPSAAGGRLFVSTGSSVTAYQTAVLTPLETAPPPSPPANVASSPPRTPASSRPAAGAAVLSLLVRRLRARAHGIVAIVLGCPATLTCRGLVTMRLPVRVGKRSAGHGARVVYLAIARLLFGAHRARFTLHLRLTPRALALLQRRHRLDVTLTLSLAGHSSRKVDALLTR